MNRYFKSLAAAAVCITALTVLGCGGAKPETAPKVDTSKPVKVGVNPGPHAQIMDNVKKLAEKKGLKIEVVEFSDFVTPNTALAQGEIWANSFQHKPFLDATLKKEPKFNLVSAFPTALFPINIYSKKLKPGDKIPDGAKIGIPNDPTNLGRALLLLQKEKLITLKPDVGLLPTALDITANPKNLQIMELEGAQLPRVLDDPKVDVAIISTTYLQQTGLSPVHDSVFIEDKNSPYVNIVVTREDNKDAENVKEFIQSYQSPEVAKAAETLFNGGGVPGW